MLATELRDYLSKFIEQCGDGHVLNADDEEITFMASFGNFDCAEDPYCVLGFGLPKNADGSPYSGN